MYLFNNSENKNIPCQRFNLSPLAITVMLLFPFAARAQLYFDPSMISGDPDTISDLSQFERGGAQPAGTYSVDIYINGDSKGNKIMKFIAIPGNADKKDNSDSTATDKQEADKKNSAIHDDTGLIACLTKKDLIEFGINIAPFQALNSLPDEQCVSPGNYIPDAWTSFNFQEMRLDISIPQVAMQNRPRGWIAPERWDKGINAALLSYQFSSSESRGNYGNSRSHYLNLQSGVNLGAWRLRDNSIWSDYRNKYQRQNHWRHLSTYVERSLIPLKSELTIGESTTGNDVFDALSFRGVQIETDENMYPDTMRGYAPEIKGVAYSNAQISIRQNGNVIYRTFVAPGAFVINDLNPVSFGGDLQLEVTEADGSSHVYTIPYSSVPVLQRQGHIRYALTAGRYNRSGSNYTSPSFAQGTLLWGLPHNITAYGGAQLAENYRAIALGAGINLGVVGAFSADITQADSTLTDGSRHDGQSVRFMYSRSLVSTGTTLQLAGYRYSTEGFHTLDETALKGMSGWINSQDAIEYSDKNKPINWENYYNLYNNKREKVQLNLTQRIGHLGSLYLTGTRQTYWHNAATTNSFQSGFSSHWGRVSYNLSYNYSRMSGQPHPDKAMYLSLSVPLDIFTRSDADNRQNSIWATWSASHDKDGNVYQHAGLSGTALEENNLNWSLSQGYGRHAGTSGDASLDYKGTYGNVSAGYGYSSDYRQFRYGASGGMVLTGSGLTLGQPLGTTNILVAVPGASGVPVENQAGIHTDWRGYTVVPYASIYRENRVALDVNHLSDDVAIDDAVVHVIPTRGALVRADFTAHNGIRALVTLLHHGKPVPFGAIASVTGGSNGMVGDEGQVYLTGLAPKGRIFAKWGNQPDQQCTAHYSLQKAQQLIQFQENCQ